MGKNNVLCKKFVKKPGHHPTVFHLNSNIWVAVYEEWKNFSSVKEKVEHSEKIANDAKNVEWEGQL